VIERYRDPSGRFGSINRANFEMLKSDLDKYYVVDNEKFRGELVEEGP
jgi:hypothetical protein